MKTLLITLTVMLGVLLAVPVTAQALDSNGGRDQYGNRGVSHRAEEDAVWASGTFSVVATAESQDEGAALAAEPSSGGSAPPEGTPTEDNANAGDEGDAAGDEGDAAGEDTSESPKLTKLPDTGGASPLAPGILLVAGGLLLGARRVLSR